MRIGESLVKDGLLTQEQVAEALRAQVMWGARLGTNLVELGYITLDDLSKALGRQHGLPAALKSHFLKSDESLQRRLSIRLAAKHACVPIVRAGKRVVIASESPLTPAALKDIANELAVKPDLLVASIAPELRLRYQLEQVYRIERDPRYLRTAGTRSEISQVFQLVPTIPQEVEQRLTTEEISVVDGIPGKVPRYNKRDTSEQPAVLAPGPEVIDPYDPIHGDRRRYLQTLADMLADQPDAAAAVVRAKQLATREKTAFVDLHSATQRIFAGAEREAIASRSIDAIEQFIPNARSALLLIVRGHAAVSWTGFCRDGLELPALAIPLENKGLFTAVITREKIMRGESGNLNALDYLLLASLGARFGDLVVSPIKVGNHVIAMFAIATAGGARVDSVEQIAEATGAAFARLMRDASK